MGEMKLSEKQVAAIKLMRTGQKIVLYMDTGVFHIGTNYLSNREFIKLSEAGIVAFDSMNEQTRKVYYSLTERGKVVPIQNKNYGSKCSFFVRYSKTEG